MGVPIKKDRQTLLLLLTMAMIFMSCLIISLQLFYLNGSVLVAWLKTSNASSLYLPQRPFMLDIHAWLFESSSINDPSMCLRSQCPAQ